MLNKISPLILGGFVAWIFYTAIASAMYTFKLTKFFNVDYTLNKHGVVMNGQIGFGNYINISDLAVTPLTGGGTVEEWCPGVNSERGYVTMGIVGHETAVCCNAADESQWLVPYKDVGEQRHYLCGKWPSLDHVTQPIKNAKLKISN